MKTEGQAIVIEPAESDMVYVPEYDPWLVYGAALPVWPSWYFYPKYVPHSFFLASGCAIKSKVRF